MRLLSFQARLQNVRFPKVSSYSVHARKVDQQEVLSRKQQKELRPFFYYNALFRF